MNKQELLKQTILNQSFADAFGYVIEFNRVDTIKVTYGEKGFTLEQLNKSSKILISDDTQMSLFALEGLKNCINEDNVFNYSQSEITSQFKNWFQTQDRFKKVFSTSACMEQPFLFAQRAPGKTCMTSLEQIIKYNENFSTKITPNESKGCGGIMRAMPFAFFANNEIEAYNYGAEQAAITHGHVLGYQSAGFYSLVAYNLLVDNSSNYHKGTKHDKAYNAYIKSKQFINNKIDTNFSQLNSNLAKLDEALDLYFNDGTILSFKELNKYLGEGWIAEESLNIALYYSIVSLSIEQCLELSTNHDGDSDSTAMLSIGLYFLANQNETLDPYFNQMKELKELNNILDIITPDFNNTINKKELDYKSKI